MTHKRTKEFDAFGPWIYEIGEKHDFPPLFENYREITADAKMVFKIPRHIERRNANPDMNLYDAVVAIFEKKILLLSRNASDVIETHININDIKALRVTQCLLSGSLILYAENQTYTIDYNTVSQNIIKIAVDLIRRLQNLPKHETQLSPMNYSIKTIEYLYVNLINDLKKTDENIQLIAYQPNMKIPKKKGIKALFQRHPNLQCCAFLHNKKELIIISRTTDFNTREKVSYAYNYVYIPIANISSVKRTEYKNDPVKNVLTIIIGKHIFSVLFDRSGINIKQLYEELR